MQIQSLANVGQAAQGAPIYRAAQTQTQTPVAGDTVSIGSENTTRNLPPTGVNQLPGAEQKKESKFNIGLGILTAASAGTIVGLLGAPVAITALTAGAGLMLGGDMLKNHPKIATTMSAGIMAGGAAGLAFIQGATDPLSPLIGTACIIGGAIGGAMLGSFREDQQTAGKGC
ncbi:MAG: hypothetical protein LWY06_09495 [Firmicutes bacterium]|nr:hypothetical protein [Bacillota bacterium]